MLTQCSGGSRGSKSGHGPLPRSKLSMEFGPLGGRKSNDSNVNLSKCKAFGPPYRCRQRIWPPPLRKNTTLKRSTTKKKIFQERPKKVVKNFCKNLAPRFWSSGSASDPVDVLIVGESAPLLMVSVSRFFGGGEIDLDPNNHGFKKSACILYGSYTFKMPMGIL